MDQITLASILNKCSSLRIYLTQEKYHLSKSSIPKEDLTPDKEPNIRGIISHIAQLIMISPDIILIDRYSAITIKKDWLSLQERDVLDKNGEIIDIDTRTRPGHKILDHYMPHFVDVQNHKGMSVRNLTTQESLEKALLQNVQMHSTPYKSEIRRMLVMTGGLGSVTKYRTITSKAIIQYFGARRVLDPCSGWGGRMLGSLAARNDTFYIGCEPDPNTAKGLRNMLDDNSIPSTVRSRARILEIPAERAFAQLANMERFDIILTSPPYFNLEMYTAGDQSTNHYTSWDDWVNKWLKVVILGCLACLKEGGVSCWSVKNFKSDKKYPLEDITKKIHKDAGWDLIKTVSRRGSGRPGGNRIEDGEEQRGSEEDTFCFRKGSLQNQA